MSHMTEEQEDIIMLAEDDDNQFHLTQMVFENYLLRNTLRRTVDGKDLMDYLLHRGKYSNPKDAPRPCIILLDLNMPNKNGFEALKEIKEHPDLKNIPVIILTISDSQSDREACYALGASSFIQKPMSLEKLATALKVFKDYWIKIVHLGSPVTKP